MVFVSVNPVAVGGATKKGHYDLVFDNTLDLNTNKANLSDVPPLFSPEMYLRTHPDSDQAAGKIMIVNLPWAVMSTGVRATGFNGLVIDMSAAGAGGIDTGVEQASTWYKVHCIRKSSDGTKAGIAQRAKDYLLDEDTLGGGADDSSHVVRNASNQLEIAMGFEVDTAGLVEFVDVKIAKVGAPTGSIWLELRAASGGSPSGAAVATSRKYNVASLPTTAYVVRFYFPSPVALATLTQYQLILNADYAASGVNHVVWRGDSSAPAYARGEGKRSDGAGGWTALGADMYAQIYVTRNDTALVLPAGYDQSCLLGYFYNDSGSNLRAAQFMGRRMVPLAEWQDAGSGGLVGGTPTLRNVPALLPPIPVLFALWTRGTATATANDFRFAGVPDGYINSVSHREGGRSRVGMPEGAGASQLIMGEVAPFRTEFQGYYWHTSGTIEFVAVGWWEW